VVLDDPEEAAVAVAAGHDVVLLCPDPATLGRPLADAGVGRLAVLVGSPDDPADRAAAVAMDAELFERGAISGPA